MSKRTESKYKINRRLGVNLWGRAKSPLNRREYGPGQHGQRRKKPSDYGTQLSAKQKLKGYYANIGERQFRRLCPAGWSSAEESEYRKPSVRCPQRGGTAVAFARDATENGRSRTS